ncbi:GldM family protein [Fluviicola sp.]|uniref:type IX secretion system motor protein PorM/GldM n=1 Tax=Fluviicola sp. TaxID=1917219 RepID=UPI0031D778F4
MAGGKETPRQKMIGMMYLVLTALLALNVSTQILDAFVAIEENIQKANVAQMERGDGFKSAVDEELSTTPKNAENDAKRQKLQKILKQMDDVNNLSDKMLKSIDKIKLDILTKAGEAVKEYKKDSEEHILWEKEGFCKPIRMHLAAVQAKDQYDIPMHTIIGEDIKTPTGSGKQLWADFNQYRIDMVKTVGTYNDGGNNFGITPTAINTFKTNADLVKSVQQMIKQSKANHRDDDQVLQDIYIGLTKPERMKVHDVDGVHWIGATFDHSPLVAALASLSSMQQDVLSARALALAHLKSKVSTGEYSFNKIVGLAYGPSIANTGDEVELKVMMAAFDSDNQPEVTGPGAITVEGGQGTLKTKVSGGAEMVLNGTVSIKNKSGVKKTENWTHTIKIMKPQGTVSLPELNVLYKGYNNIVEGVASGYDQTILNGNGVTLSKSGTQYIGRVSGAGRTATISISGKNSVTNKTVSLGTFTFRVMNLPPPSLFFGATEDGGKASKAETRLFARYSDSPLKAEFSVQTWELNVAGAPRPAKGTGNVLNADGISLLKQAKPGSSISFMTQVKGPDGILRKKSGVFTI